jgi:serine/threonine protein phosphatase PrpC
MSIGGTLPTVTFPPPPGAVGLAPIKARRGSHGVILAEAEMTEVASFEIAGGTAAAFTTPSPGKSTPNEDAAGFFSVGKNHGVLAVADGLGGHAVGERASREAIEILWQTLDEAAEISTGDPFRSAILNGIEAANRAVKELGGGAATTLALVEIQDRTVRTYHVGDSTILLAGQRGKLKLQTIAHSPIGYAVESGLIDEEAAIHHEERHVISNVIGSDQMRIEIGPTIEMAARDTLVLASDGLLDNLLPQEIVDRVRTGPLAEAVDSLVQLARHRMHNEANAMPSKPDDLTVIAFRLG